MNYLKLAVKKITTIFNEFKERNKVTKNHLSTQNYRPHNAKRRKDKNFTDINVLRIKQQLPDFNKKPCLTLGFRKGQMIECANRNENSVQVMLFTFTNRIITYIDTFIR